MPLEVAVECSNELGESVFWSEPSRQIYWIDGARGEIHCWGGEASTHQVHQPGVGAIGMIAPTREPHILVMTGRDGVSLRHLREGTSRVVSDPEQGREGIGYNDGKVDPRGRLWVGTYDSSELEPRATLWKFEHGCDPVLADSGMAVVNGPAFSPSGDVMYLSDSIGRRILAFDLKEGKLSGRRVFARCTDAEGFPDGLTVDALGYVWCAHWDGSRVTRFSPSGERDRTVMLPVPRATSVCFGGENLETLFITTARYGLTPEQLGQAPLAGALFSCHPGVQGLLPTPLSLPFEWRSACAV